MTTDAEKIEVQKAALGGADIERTWNEYTTPWEPVPKATPNRWNWDDFDYRVAEAKPVSAFMARLRDVKTVSLPGADVQHKGTWNACLDAVENVLPLTSMTTEEIVKFNNLREN